MTFKSSPLEVVATHSPMHADTQHPPHGKPALSAPGLRQVIEGTVAGVFGIDVELLRQPTRGRANIALARQVAMYIAHVGCGLSLTEVGAVFERDRTTVAHACAIVEQRRDDDHFDAAIHLLDLVIRVIDGTRQTQPPATRIDPALTHPPHT